MAFLIENIVYKWLRTIGVNINRDLLNAELAGHPDYPSLLSITRTLDKLGIDNIAMQVDKEKLSQVPLPFLAHIYGEDGFLLVENLSALDRKADFHKTWTGVILVAEKPDNWVHKKNTAWQKKQNLETKRRFFAFAFVFLTALTVFFIKYNILAAGLYVTAALGLGVAILIVQHELGFENVLTDQLCFKNKNIDCDAVLTSGKAKLNQFLGWSDLGVIYFSFMILFLLVAATTDSYKSALIITGYLSAGGLLFGLFSVFYQWRVVKRWCTLCLSIVLVLWIQAMMLLPSLLSFSIGWPSFLSLHSAIMFMTGMAVLWLLLLKPLLLKNKQSGAALSVLLRFKKNKELLLHLLANQKKVEATPFRHEISIGDPDAPLQIIAASNPYCNPCSKAHAVLDELADQYSNQIGISFRFLVDTTDVEKTAATTYIFQSLAALDAALSRQEKENDTRKILRDWFDEKHLDAFKKKHPLPFVPDVREQLNDNGRWAFENNIDYTPAIFINGSQLPPQYTYSDLPLIVDGLLFGADPEQKADLDYRPVFALEV